MAETEKLKASAGSKVVKAILIILIVLAALAVFGIQNIPTMEDQWAKDVANSQEFKDFSVNESLLTYLLVVFVVLLILSIVLPHIRRKKETLAEKVGSVSKAVIGKSKQKIGIAEPKKESRWGRRIKWFLVGLVIALLLVIVLGIQMLPTIEGTESLVNSDAFRIASKGVWIPASLLFWLIILIVIHFVPKIVRKALKKPAGERKHKWLLKTGNFVLSIVLFILVFLLTVAFWPVQSDVVVADPINTQVFAALSQGGITQSNTAIEESVVHVSYQLPSGLEKEQAELFVLGVISTINTQSKEAWISTYRGSELLGEIRVSMSDVLSRKSGEITDQELRNRFN